MGSDQLVLEYWKIYEAYMTRKEQLIHVATTLYLAFASALLIQPWNTFWLIHSLPALVLAAATALLVWRFLYQQFRMWSDAAWICNSSQTLLAEWLANPSATKNMTPTDLPCSPGVKAPQALVDEMNHRLTTRRSRPASAPFETVVYGLLILWTIALTAHGYSAWLARP
jgi:hypothetical protein